MNGKFPSVRFAQCQHAFQNISKYLGCAREAGWRFAAKIPISDYFFTFKLLPGHFRPRQRLVRMEGDTEIAELESDIRTLRKQLKEKVQQLKTLKKHFQKVSVVYQYY